MPQTTSRSGGQTITTIQTQIVMKLLTTTAVLATFTAVFATASFAESTSSRPAKGDRPAKPDSATIVAHLTENYAKIAPYDANVNGQLDEAEQAKLAAAITAGTVTFTPPAGHAAPDGSTPPAPPAGQIVHHLAEMYAAVAPYDADANGSLSTGEQAALKTAVESGKIPGPGGHDGHGHGRKGPGHMGDKGGPDESEG